MIFILSTGRSGTRSLAEWFNRSRSVRAEHEPEPLLVDEIVRYVRRELPEPAMAELLSQTRIQEAGGREYVESNHMLTYCIGALGRAFPGASYVWLLRDGRDVVVSLMARQTFEGQPLDDVEGEWLMRRFSLAWFGEMSPAAWHELPAFAKACWYWEKTNALIEEHLCGLPAEKWLQLRIEFEAEALARMRRRFHFLRLSDDDLPIVNRSKRMGPSWTRWEPEQRRWFEEICGESMDKFYPGWRDREGQWRETYSLRVGRRGQMVLQARARNFIFADTPVSRIMLRNARRLPRPIKGALKRIVGLT